MPLCRPKYVRDSLLSVKVRLLHKCVFDVRAVVEERFLLPCTWLEWLLGTGPKTLFDPLS